MSPNGFQKCSSFLENAGDITRGVAHFSMTYLGSELNLILFAFGHLNAIKYFKCSNNHKLKCLLLDIFQKVVMISFMIFGNALAFLLKPNTFTENRKWK